MQRVGVDTGGTFTDAAAPAPEGGWRVHKVPTTPRAPELGVLEAVRGLLKSGGGPVELVHGTTHATNALLTGRLGRVAFVTTAGFADVLAIGRQDRERVYALEPRPPRPPQPRRRIVEARERLDADGRILIPLSGDEIARVAAAVAALAPQAIAVGLLHSYRNPAHEHALGRALQALGVPVILSSEVASEQREYERFTTAWADAALQPVVAPALRALDAALRRAFGAGSRLCVMRSDGGTASVAAAAQRPVALALSGPAGGLAAARALADARGDDSVLTLDMGGTSTDVALLRGGELPLQSLQLAGLPLLTRGLPVHSVGTGGGSLAAHDRGGALRVGPDSAGAEPGPACYGRGGRAATVTDAHLLAGRLHPQAFLGGGFPLDLAAAENAVRALGARPEDILAVATADMERALRRVSLAEGHDTRGLTLYAFGGAGGLHAAWLAGRLGMRRVLLPPLPGAFSALGLATAAPRRTLAMSVLRPLPPEGERSKLFAGLVERALAELEAEGVPRARIRVQTTLELRGEGQAGELALPEGPRARERFLNTHRARFGYAQNDRPVILVAVRVRADGPSASPWRRVAQRRHAPRPFERRRVLLPEGGGRCSAAWYRREELLPGAQLKGPAIVAEYSATTVVPAGWQATVDGFGALELRRG
ncbi:MAG: hydantoinase/oxoprolinase family protein [Planctomycetota bacterium]|nr:MAG: hydantoinase/oxoprolinase family protein [Planctomycetota bacterium]